MNRHLFSTARGAQSALVSTSAGPAAPWLHFGHATGMHAHLYTRLLMPLASRFNIIAADFRGHGESPFPIDDRVCNSWQDLADDTMALLDVVAPGRQVWLMGHSLGAVCGLVCLEQHPARLAGLLLLDPPLAKARPVADFSPDSLARAFAHVPQALGRRPSFPDRESILARYRGRGVFSNFSEEDLAAYVDGGFAPGADGLHLRCTPHWEAATFNGLMEDISHWPGCLQRPFSLVAGEVHSTVSDAELARYAAHPLCRDALRIAGTDHFVALQAPDEVRSSLLRLVES